jgi:plastin-1
MEDNEAYPCLLNVLAPEYSVKPSLVSVKDLHTARIVLEHEHRMGCKRYLALKYIVWFTKSKSRFCGSYFQNLKL